MSKPMNPEDALRRARAARDRAVKTAMRRKEEYLGARVPKALKERVIAQAEREGIPVSLLIRRTLEAAFPEPERPVAPTPPASAALAQVFAWQPVEVAREGHCAACGRSLPAGAQGWLAIGGGEPALVCGECKTGLNAHGR